MAEAYKEKMKQKMDAFVHKVFKMARSFPREEIYVTASQIKRAALSIVLNYIEGFARIKKGNQLNFFEISYGSLKETKYLLYFSMKEGFLNDNDYQDAIKSIEEIAAMLWTEIASLSRSLEN